MRAHARTHVCTHYGVGNKSSAVRVHTFRIVEDAPRLLSTGQEGGGKKERKNGKTDEKKRKTGK